MLTFLKMLRIFETVAIKELWFFLGLFPSLFFAQTPSIDDFVINGQTVRTGDQCYRLTPAVDWSSGGVWYRDAIDLSGSFEMELQLMFGCDDVEGADGMVFVFTPYQGASGFQGEGMGFGGLRPSLGIEIDTWENDHLADPPEDHIAILRDGYVMHNYNMAGPAIIPNVEDCALHSFNISWNQPAHRLSIALDGDEVLSYQGDIVDEIFRGNPMVFWGVTAATGQYNNRHEICFEKILFTEPLSKIYFDRVTQKKYLMGQVMTLEETQFESDADRLEDSSFPELHKLINLLQRNPKLDVQIDAHSDASLDKVKALRSSEAQAKAIADYLRNHGINQKRLTYRGHGDRFPSGDANKSDQRIEIHLYQAKT